MTRFCALWLLLVAIASAIVAALTNARRLDLQLLIMAGAAVVVALLLRLLPGLRDRDFRGIGNAMRGPQLEVVVTALLVVTTLLAWYSMVDFANVRGFEIARGVVALLAAIAFATAAARGVRGAAGAAALFALLAIATGWTVTIVTRLAGPEQPSWLVIYGVVVAVTDLVLQHCLALLRRSAPDSATLLDWASLPATITILVLAGNLLRHPSITRPSILLSNAGGFVALGVALLAGVAAMYGNASGRPAVR